MRRQERSGGAQRDKAARVLLSSRWAEAVVWRCPRSFFRHAQDWHCGRGGTAPWPASASGWRGPRSRCFPSLPETLAEYTCADQRSAFSLSPKDARLHCKSFLCSARARKNGS
eukprot:2290405-Rhodomonas_salina.2